MKSVNPSVLLSLLLFAGVLAGQDRPQFVWQGQVDGIDILYLRGKKLNARVQEGAPIQRQQFHFYDPLPDSQLNARLEVMEGRGYVHIIDQPRLDNQYTLAISIEDRQAGSSFYSIAVYWDASNRRFDRSRTSARRDSLAWSGRVDEEAIVSCHDNTCASAVPHGAPVAEERFKFSRPLPHRDVDVSIDDQDGRGDIRVVEQPRERNKYTAQIAIRDPQAGAADYSFRMTWDRPNGKETEPPVVAQRGLVWSGVVDGRVRVTIQGGAAFSEVLDGRPITGEHVEILRPLSARSGLNPSIRKIQGRGQVAIVESPSAQNNYRLAFEINDPDQGADNYEVEVDW